MFALRKHLGLIGIWLIFIVFGILFYLIGTQVNDIGLGFKIFGSLFIVLSSAFVLFTLPSSFKYYYNKALTKKYGSYTFATVTNKRIDDYSHTTSTLKGGKAKKIETFLYVIEFQFNYITTTYHSECAFKHQSTYNAITEDTELPIKFLKTNPKIAYLRRRKLANQLGIPEKDCQ